MAICRATKASGEPCTLAASGPQGFCWAHDPANRDKRSRMASKAARSKPNRELSEIKELLKDLTERVLGEEGTERLETGPAAVANQLINTRLRAIEQERKIKETKDLEARIGALELVAQARQKGARPWGA